MTEASVATPKSRQETLSRAGFIQDCNVIIAGLLPAVVTHSSSAPTGVGVI